MTNELPSRLGKSLFVPILVLFVATLGSLVGCGGPQLASVTGTVTYKNEPLKQGTILFHSGTRHAAAGKIVDGKILEVTTFAAGDGATPGPNKVTIVSLENPDDMYSDKSLIPVKYSKVDESNLSCDLKPDRKSVV